MSWPIGAADVRAELRYTAAQGDTDDLEFFAAAAVERIEDKIGKVTGRAATVETYGPRAVVLLHERSARIDSILIDGEPIALDGFRLVSGALVRGPFPAGAITVRTITVADDSALIVLAARRLAALWWKQSKNGPNGGPGIDADTASIMGVGMPRAVEAMLVHRSNLPGMA